MHHIIATLRLAAVLLAATAALPAAAQATGARIIVQQSPLAGFQY